MPNKTRALGTISAASIGQWIDAAQGPLNAQATLLTATAAIVDIEVSTDRVGGVKTQTITLSAGTPSDGFLFDEETSWPYIRMNVTSVTGGSVIASATVKE